MNSNKKTILALISSITALLVVITLILVALIPGKMPVNPAESIYGERSITALEDLCFVNTQSQYFQQSSYDRTGGNGDAYGCSFPEPNESFNNREILNVSGPGQVTNIWFTWGSESYPTIDSVNQDTRPVLPEYTRLRFYFDGEETPSIDMSVEDMSIGTNAPFLSPLVLDLTKTSGGWTFYIPITFEKSLRIEGDNLNFWHVGYEMLPQNTKVTSFNMQTDYAEAIDQLNKKGELRDIAKNAKLIQNDNQGLSSNGDTISLCDIKGSNRIYALRINIPELADLLKVEDGWNSKRAREIVKNISIKAYWDGDKQPAVDSPIGLFFTSNPYFLTTLESYVLGLTDDGTLYCYFPMPFKKSGKIELVATDDISLDNVTTQVYYDKFDGPWEYTGYFTTQRNLAEPVELKQPVTILNTTGMGHFVGVSQNIDSDQRATGFCLEGDEILYIDDKPTHTMAGTGTEDFYLGAWYFKYSLFQQAFHGLTNKYIEKEENGPLTREYFSMYRWFITEPIVFRRSIDFTIEHSAVNDSKYEHNYDMLAYYYLIPNKIMKSNDFLKFDSDGAKGHSYSATNADDTYYELVSAGDVFYRNDVYIMNYGNKVNEGGIIKFKMGVNNRNNGVVLRRLLNAQTPNQKAEVYVNGEYVGIWHDSFAQAYDSSVDAYYSDFIIPDEYTRGKMKISIELKVCEGSTWTQHSYETFSIPD